MECSRTALVSFGARFANRPQRSDPREGGREDASPKETRMIPKAETGACRDAGNRALTTRSVSWVVSVPVKGLCG